MANQSTIDYLSSLAEGENKREFIHLPELREFRSTELPFGLKKDNTEDLTDMLYFLEHPYSEVPGYYAEDTVFVVKGTPDLSGQDLGSFDADTLYFPLNSIDDNGATIVYNNNTFTIKNYIESSVFDDRIGVRFVGINAPETNKYRTIDIESADKISVTVPIEEVIRNNGKRKYYYDESTISSGTKTLKFIPVTIDNVDVYCQITHYVENGIKKYKYLYKVADTESNENGQKILSKLKELIGGHELVMVLDHTALNDKGNDYPTTYEDFDDGSISGNIRVAIEALKPVNHGPYYSGFSNYGQDPYGRFLGCLYVKTRIPGLPDAINDLIGDQWINVTKYLLYYFSDDIPLDFGTDPASESMFNNISSAFKLWTYDRKPQKVIDLLDNISNESITKQRQLQKEILGFDFDSQLKDWTVMIGDCVFMVPPTSIRCVTRNNAESVPLIRSRGSAIKELPQSERIIEMTLYFNDESGINGVEIEAPVFESGEYRRFNEKTLKPENENVKYYMNGLRALISMFKLCPFMPITNTYINDTLNVDAVALSSLTVATMPNYPKCIAATIQLMEFNYHVYMSELPLTGDESAETIIHTNLFEKCIDFDTLRYYYQKPLYRGEVASRHPFDSDEYLRLTYGSRTALQPITNFGDSSIEFYFPDKEHLNRLLQAKIESMNNPLKTQYSVTDDVKEWAYELGGLYHILNDFLEQSKELFSFIQNGPVGKNGEPIFSVYGRSDGFTSVNPYSYDKFCDLFSDDPNAITTHKYHLTKNNSYLRSYYSKSVDSSFIWHIDPSTYNSANPCFDIQLMLNDLVNGIISKHAYSCNVLDNHSNNVLYNIAFNLSSNLSTNRSNIINFAKNISIDIEENISEWLSNDCSLLLKLCFELDDSTDSFDKKVLSVYIDDNSPVLRLVEFCYKNFTRYGRDEDGNIQEFGLPSDVMQDNVLADKQSTDVDTISTLKFEKYPNDDMLQSLIVTNISSSVCNNLSRIYLKAIDGYAPQYLGGQDTIIEVSMVTQDAGAAAAINLLPKLCSEYIRNYHLILSCCPLRINTQFTRLLGVNEVLVETVDVSTVKSQPGLYEVNMRLVSVDRTARNKEALKNIDINNAGSRISKGTNNYTVRDYFDVRNKIAAAEIYPDLELPTLAELELYGFNFIRYKIFDSGRVYPDPDFYFIYGAATANQIIRDTLLANLDNTGNADPPGKTFKYTDYLGGELSVDIIQNGSSENPQLFVETKDSKNLTATLENGLIITAENAASIYNTYKNSIKVQESQVYTYTDNTDNSVGINFSEFHRIASLIDSFSGYEHWNFSSELKGLLREPEYINCDISSFNEYISGALNTISSFIGFSSDIYKAYDLLSFDKTKYDSLQELNESYRTKVETAKQLLSRNFDYSVVPYTRYTDGKRADLGCDCIINIIFSIADAMTGSNFYQDDDDKNEKSMWAFNCFRNNINKPIPINDATSDNYHTSKSYSAFYIRTYPGEYIKTYFGDLYKNNFSGKIDVDSLYPEKQYFLNPDIMLRQHDVYQYELNKSVSQNRYDGSKNTVAKYKEAILYDPSVMIYEAIVNVFIYFLALIYSGVLISNYQLLTGVFGSASSLSKFIESLNIDTTSDEYAAIEKIVATFGEQEDDKSKDETSDAVIGSAKSSADSLFEKIAESKNKLIFGNFVITALVYINGFESDLYDNILRRNYPYLNDLLASAVLPINSHNHALTYKFLLSLAARKVINSIEDIGSSEYTVSDFASSILSENARIEEENDPYRYTRDSFYDMITTDMRGRMARAFPTFYLLFVDEGREIGWWKLNDNFYNMSSINEITVTKSRKIAADTCTISMTNMFKTFTTDDEDTKEMSYDLETLSTFETSFKDVWDSIFSPRKLFLKEYQERLEQNPIDRAQLKPGVRVHVRMGYGGDAYSLPCVFNGVVAEVSTGEVINIVCQGDGVELTNPILEDFASSDDIVNYDSTNFLWLRDIQNILTKGATPKTILTKFLTAKGRGIEKAINKWSQGRFFDDNPFGISHFGDPDFTTIWGNSECSQNIYEAMSTPAFDSDDSYTETLRSSYSMSSAPKVSTQILGKSYWDLMNVMAAMSPDYIASTAPLGMRSTIFYGLPHYYYTYEYDKIYSETYSDGSTAVFTTSQLREKRKPFQQAHIYTSYSDIIENNISASSKYMKTNATGIYYQNGAFGNTSTKKVGPLFADIDIYSEYQKAMTVDTSFIAQGVSIPIIGDLVPYLNSLTTDLGWFGNEEEKVAWRITARALKDAVKEMYQGELITIGDPSVKPYDLAHIVDIYENMGGGCEVEAVTHILSSQTGFTTSIYVDPMIDIDNRYYQTAHTLTLDTVKNVAHGYTSVFLVSLLLSKNTQPFTKLATHAMSNIVNGTADTASTILRFIPMDDKYSDKAVEFIQGWNVLGNSDIVARYKTIEGSLKKLAKRKLDIDSLDFTSQNDIHDVLDQITDLYNLNTDSILDTLSDKDVLDKLSKLKNKDHTSTIESATEQIRKISTSRNNAISNNLKSIVDKTKEIADKIDDKTDVVDDAVKFLTDTPIDTKNINKHMDAVRTILDSVDSANITDDLQDALKASVKSMNSVTDDAIKVLTKSDDILGSLKAATYVVRGSNPLVLILTTVAEILVEAIIVGTVNNNISRYLRNLETLRIYPLTKNGKVFTAGLNGSKGIVVGSSTYDEQGWLQNTIMNIWDKHPTLTAIAGFFFDVDAWKTITDSWKNDNGMAQSDENVTSAQYVISDLLSSVSGSFASPNLANQNSIALERIKTLYVNNASDEDEKNAQAAFLSSIVVDTELLNANSSVSNMIKLSDVRSNLKALLPESLRRNNNLMAFYHEFSAYNEGSISVYYKDKVIPVPCYHPEFEADGKYLDLPFVREDINDIFYDIMECIKSVYPEFYNSNLDPIRLYVTNALMPSYFDSWLSTGYSCNFYIQNISDEELELVFDTIRTVRNNMFEFYACGTIECNGVEYTMYNITVYPPLRNGTVSDYILSKEN